MWHHPVHVTARAVGAAPSMRSERVYSALRDVFAGASEKGFGLLHFSVQGNHLHLIVEADGDVALARGLQRLLSRAAMAVNTVARRAGRLWRDRHHRRPLTCPRQVRNAYAYVLFNDRKHRLEQGDAAPTAAQGFDRFSSWPWFDGWTPEARPSPSAIARAGPRPVDVPHTWLARTGWRTCGLLRADETPRTP